jgi:hypothetical protein
MKKIFSILIVAFACTSETPEPEAVQYDISGAWTGSWFCNNKTRCPKDPDIDRTITLYVSGVQGNILVLDSVVMQYPSCDADPFCGFSNWPLVEATIYDDDIELIFDVYGNVYTYQLDLDRNRNKMTGKVLHRYGENIQYVWHDAVELVKEP